MGIYRLNENLSVRLKALQLYIYWDALKGLNYSVGQRPTKKTHQPQALKGRNCIQLCPFRAQIQITVFRRALPYAM